MRSRSVAPVSAALLAVLVLALLPSASSATSLAEARQQRAEVQQRLDAAAGRLAGLERRAAELEAERDALAAEATDLGDEIDALSAGIETRVIELFKRGSSRDPLTVLLASDDAEAALARAQAMQFVVSADVAEAQSLAAVRTQLQAVEQRLATREEELSEAVDAQADVMRELTRDLERARQLEERLVEEERKRREEAERRRREAAEQRAAEQRAAQQRAAGRQEAAAPSAPPPSAPAASSGSGGTASVDSSGKACPVDNPRSFTDTWGAPRSGGRSHRGTDILAPRGIPVRAITSGTWSIQNPGPSAGLWAILRGDDGNQYWYMHLDSHTVGNGARVSAGQQTGTNGDTGNARGTPHVHFELHPGGGSAINPYPMLKQVCG